MLPGDRVPPVSGRQGQHVRGAAARSTREFFSELDAHLAEATSYEDLLVRGLVAATRALRDDEHLQLMLASAPGEVMTELTVAGLPRIFDAATLFLTPRFAPHIGTEASDRLAEWLARVVISYFLSPSRHVDLGDPESARPFVDQFVLPAFPSTLQRGLTAMSTEISDMIGRADVNDLEAILAITNTDVDAVQHAVKDNADAIFTWDYEQGAPSARASSTRRRRPSVERRDRPALGDRGRPGGRGHRERRCRAVVSARTPTTHRHAVREVGRQGVARVRHQSPELDAAASSCTASRARSICTAKIVETVPWIDAKYYAATQVMDEARHVEVFAKYLDTKLSGHYPINAHLRLLLDDIVDDSRWDMTYLGMQIMVEGLALAAFGFMHQITTEPLLKQLLRYVMSDEARHVAFGVLCLQGVLRGLSAAEIRERQEFAFEAAVRMRDRFLQQEVWERMGISPKDMIPYILSDDTRGLFQQMLFSKIVPNCKKLGLLDAADGWLRRRSTSSASSSSRTGPTPARSTSEFAARRRRGQPARRPCPIRARTVHRADQGRAGRFAPRWPMPPTRVCSSLHALRLQGLRPTVEDRRSRHRAQPSRRSSRQLVDHARARSGAASARHAAAGRSTPEGAVASRRSSPGELTDAGVERTPRGRTPRFLELNEQFKALCGRLAAAAPAKATTGRPTTTPTRTTTPRSSRDCARSIALAQGCCVSFSDHLDRVRPVRAAADRRPSTRVEAGDREVVHQAADVDSYHTVWFELHEDLLADARHRPGGRRSKH